MSRRNPIGKAFGPLVRGLSKRFDIDAAIEQGNAHSAKNEWCDAASRYAQALQFDPENAPIWVQLGHMHKEAGDAERAADAYRRALALDPSEAEVSLHLGHLLKNVGDSHGAAEAFVGCLRADTEMHDAYEQLLHLGWARKDILAAAPRLSFAHLGHGESRVNDRQAIPASVLYKAVSRMTFVGKRSRPAAVKDQ